MKIENDESEITMNKIFYDQYYDSRFIDGLKEKILLGDTLAYEQMKEIYYFSGHRHEFLYFALLMSNRSNYSQSYDDCYFIMKHLNKNSSDTFISSLPDYFLKKSKNPAYLVPYQP